MRASACLGHVCATCSGHARRHYVYILLCVWGGGRGGGVGGVGGGGGGRGGGGGGACVCACVWAYVSGSSIFAAFAQHLCRVDVGLAIMSEWVCVHGRVLDLGSTGGVCMGAGQCTVCACTCV